MARGPQRPRTILAFGEDATDTKALKELVRALRPDLPTMSPRREPIILSVMAAGEKKRTMARRMFQVIKAAQVENDVLAVLAHRDLDDVDPREEASELLPAEVDLRQSLEAELQSVGAAVVPVVPAWEIEAWWFLWPDQVAELRPGWRTLPDRTGKRVDQIANAKETLRRELQPTEHRRVPSYSESDGPRIAAKVREAGVARDPKGRSIAYLRFIKAIDGLKA
jgi:hypothetical protein